MEKQLFVIGNGAYTGANALAVLFSVEDAVNELELRGMLRVKALDLLCEMDSALRTTPFHYCNHVVSLPIGMCEVGVYADGHTPYGWPSYEELKVKYGKKGVGMKSSETLRKARVLIESGDEEFLCLAIDDVGGEKTAVARNLASTFPGCMSLESYMLGAYPDFVDFYAPMSRDEGREWMRLYRLDWIDWLIPQYEAVGD